MESSRLAPIGVDGRNRVLDLLNLINLVNRLLVDGVLAVVVLVSVVIDIIDFSRSDGGDESAGESTEAETGFPSGSSLFTAISRFVPSSQESWGSWTAPSATAAPLSPGEGDCSEGGNASAGPRSFSLILNVALANR